MAGCSYTVWSVDTSLVKGLKFKVYLSAYSFPQNSLLPPMKDTVAPDTWKRKVVILYHRRNTELIYWFQWYLTMWLYTKRYIENSVLIRIGWL
jgi:hypothetical protein